MAGRAAGVVRLSQSLRAVFFYQIGLVGGFGEKVLDNQPLALEYIGYIATSTIATWVATRCSERPASAIQGLVGSANTGVFAIQL